MTYDTAKNELVMLNFYADWCRFSQMLAPIWDEFAEKLSARFPEEGKVVVGKVDCDNEAAISTRWVEGLVPLNYQNHLLKHINNTSYNTKITKYD